jgi:hypothetical protein
MTWHPPIDDCLLFTILFCRNPGDYPMSGDDHAPRDGELTTTDEAVLAAIDAGAETPGAVAIAVDSPAAVVYDRLGRLRAAGYVERRGWSTCALTGAGAARVRERRDRRGPGARTATRYREDDPSARLVLYDKPTTVKHPGHEHPTR